MADGNDGSDMRREFDRARAEWVDEKRAILFTIEQCLLEMAAMGERMQQLGRELEAANRELARQRDRRVG